ncbi:MULTISPECIES: RimK/LysX family protein [unclassified Thioalkalivibrio]|uniref:ATP-dependent zinc protease family protein n=1 Tax=unclassified Thioalkalivibrio TaxID=2621013 RepID=UPI00035F6119|nr:MULTISPECIES: RimK/LysX family protein [unclassified Thioalkalivibrio]
MHLPISVLKTATVFVALLAPVAWLPATAGTPSSLTILGTVENAGILQEDITLEARLDTGATSSSLNALQQETFERDDEKWIRFEIVDPEDADARITLERPIERSARIRQHSGELDERHVVRLELCLGDRKIEADTTLVDRTELTYQLLVGRSHMAGHILVDSGNEHLLPPDCPTDEDSTDAVE